MKRLVTLAVATALTIPSLKTLGAQRIRVAFIQINDVYEIDALDDGRSGGIARVAALKNQWKNRVDTVFLCLAGDFLSPSAMGKALIDGKELAGAQMVACLNAAGLDFATFGNHEFDVQENELLARINESKFEWISANLLHRPPSRPFVQNEKPLPEYRILRVRKKKNEFRIGLTGVTLNFTLPPYAEYRNAGQALDRVARTIKDSTDVLVAMTHLNYHEDSALAQCRPEWALFMGGHEHERIYRRTDLGTVIAKADANARSAYVHVLTFEPKNQKTRLESKIVELGPRIRPDPRVQSVVDAWMEKGRTAYRALGFEPEAVVCRIEGEWDGSEAAVRNRSNTLTQTVATAFFHAGDRPDIAFFNAGSIRIDDKLRGTLTQYDLFRILPFGGKILQAEVEGKALVELKTAGEKNRGTGGYLHWHGDTARIVPEKFYRVVFPEFLLTGRERNMAFFTRENPGVRNVESEFSPTDPRSDVRRALNAFLKSPH